MAAFERYNTRLLAQNELNQPPSFGQWVGSGGTATFPITSPGFTPKEAENLGIVGRHGEAIPFVDPSQTQLSPEQQLFLGYQQAQAGKHGPLARAYRINQRLRRMEQRPQTAQRTTREEKLRTRRTRLLTPGQGAGEELY